MRTLLTLGALTGSLTCGAASAQVAAPALTLGVTDSVVSLADSTQSYATFVPSSYRPDRTWPVVFVMDPRGRALAPLERLAPAAERLGYILMSSYDTRSDESIEPTERAVGAMLDDAQTLLSIDTRRLYFAGFSGTARAAWTFAERLPANTAGIIGFGAGLASPAQLLSLSLTNAGQLVFFGGAGDMDFNHEELRRLDRTLDDYRIPHLVEFYEGPHAWPNTEVFTHALEWLDVRATRDGLQRRTEEELRDLMASELARGASLEAAADPEGAERLYVGLIAGFEGLLDASEARRRLDAVRSGPALEREVRRIDDEVDERSAFDSKLAVWRGRFRESGRPQDVEEGLGRLGIEKLLERSADTRNTADARAATRMLEQAVTAAAFYDAGSAMAERDFELARALYRFASAIRPHHPLVCIGLARTEADLGNLEAAFESLQCAVESGAFSAPALASDPLLAPLRADPRFESLIRSLTGARPAP